jgi:D-serine dehydratase
MPALRLWAEVLSAPESDLLICGLGMRDAASDQGVPMPLKIWRDGKEAGTADHLVIEKFNDQHAFVRPKANGLLPAIGDVIEFGLSHPCTNIDRHGLIWGLDADHKVRCVLPTAFG